MSWVHRPILSSSSSNDRSKVPQLSSKSKLITTVGWVISSPLLVTPAEGTPDGMSCKSNRAGTAAHPSTFGGTSFRSRDTVTKTLESVMKMLVGKQGQIQKSRQRIVCSHQGELEWAAQRAQVRTWA